MVNSKSDRRGIEQARQLFDRGINFLQKNQLHLARARENSNKARENLDEARKNLKAAFNDADINNEDGRHLQVDILNALGSSYFVPYDWQPDQAIEICDRSLSLAKELDYCYGQAIALTVKAKVPYWSENERNFPLAIEYYDRAKSIFQEIQNLEGRDVLNYLDILDRLQDSYGYISKYAQAIKINYERLDIANQLILTGNQSFSDGNEQTGNEWVLFGKEQEASALFCLATNYLYLGQYPDARKYYEQCLIKVSKMNGQQCQRLQANSLAGLGDIDLIDGNLDDAINKYQQSLTIARNIDDEKGQANLLQQLANIYLYYYRDLNRAWNYNEQSLEIKRNIGDQIGEGNSIGFKGSIFLARDNYDKALKHFNQSLPIIKKVGNESGIASTLTNIGNTYYCLGELPQAEQCLNEAIEVWESIRKNLGIHDEFKVSIFEQQARTYRIQQAVLIAQNKTKKALEVAERGRARAFVELLDSRLSPSRTDELTTPPPTIEEIQQIAQAQNSTLVEYSIIGLQSLFIWVIQPTGKVAFRRVDLKQLQINNTLENLVRDIRNAIGNAIGVTGRIGKAETTTSTIERERLPQSLQQLHRILIQPIADLLPTEDTARVIFIPQGSLFLVPFPALQDDFGQYLIKKHTILTAPSIQVLDLTRRQQAEAIEAALKEALVLGQSTFEPPYGPLQETEKEAEAIAKLLNTKAITGSDGTKALIIEMMLKARTIHLATHGKLDVERGLDSAIVLAPSDNKNVLLTAKEILKLKLNAELVVLSACDTGRGRLTGDGVIGLSRSFICAGVPSIIVSLWAIPDSETAGLMTEFYRQFLQNSDKAQALRQAMLMTIKNHPHPKNWAAFTLIGEAA